MGLKDIETTLPPGFRFHPSDEELVCHYLHTKVANGRLPEGTMVEVDLHTLEPWELPEVAKLNGSEWYFFSFKDRKYATGSRANRATKTGYWKATGKDRTVYDPRTKEITGMRKTLVFYRGRAPNGRKTRWIMHEFRVETPHTPSKEDWVLCRVFQKRNGEGEQEATMDSHSSAAISSSPYHNNSNSNMYQQMMPAAFYEDQISSTLNPLKEDSSSSLLNLALMQCNFLGFQNEVEATPVFGGNGDDDDNGFLLEDFGGGWSLPNWHG